MSQSRRKLPPGQACERCRLGGRKCNRDPSIPFAQSPCRACEAKGERCEQGSRSKLRSLRKQPQQRRRRRKNDLRKTDVTAPLQPPISVIQPPQNYPSWILSSPYHPQYPYQTLPYPSIYNLDPRQSYDQPLVNWALDPFVCPPGTTPTQISPDSLSAYVPMTSLGSGNLNFNFNVDFPDINTSHNDPFWQNLNNEGMLSMSPTQTPATTTHTLPEMPLHTMTMSHYNMSHHNSFVVDNGHPMDASASDWMQYQQQMGGLYEGGSNDGQFAVAVVGYDGVQLGMNGEDDGGWIGMADTDGDDHNGR